MDSNKRAQEIGVGMKEVINKVVVLPQVWEETNEEGLWFSGGLQFPEFDDLQVMLQVNLGFDCNAIQSSIILHQPVPDNKILQVDELIHALNGWSVTGHLYRDLRNSNLVYTSGIIIRDLGFNKAEFERGLKALLGNGCEFLNFLEKQLKSKEDPNISLQRLFLKMSKRMKGLE